MPTTPPGPRAAAPAAGPRPPRRPLARRAAAGTLALVAAVLLAGCGLRWETAAPTEPVPDAAEAARRDVVDDALALAGAARAAGPGAAEPVAAVLDAVAGTADAHVPALGGVYDSGLPEPTPSPTTSPAVTATPADVLALLGETASAARADAIDAEDPGLARLLAAVAASRAQLTDRLAAALGTEAPAVDADPEPVLPRGGSADGSGSGDGSAAVPGDAPTDEAAGEAATDGTGADGTGSDTSDGVAGEPGADDAGTDAPGGDLDRTTLAALVLAEDQAGHGFEVAAARLSGDERERARTAAVEHRTAASSWATTAGVAGTRDDPRRVAYALDGDLTAPDGVRAFCAGLLTGLAAAHADAVLATSPGTADRTATVDGLRRSAVGSLAWGAAPVALPGLAA
jgi:hypothetical protein